MGYGRRPRRGRDSFPVDLLPRISPATPQLSRIMGFILATGAWSGFQPGHLYPADSVVFEPIPRPAEPQRRGPLGGFLRLFLSNTLGILLRSVFGLHVNDRINLFLMGVSSACVVAWLVLLNAKGEKVRLSTLHFGRGDEERMLLQLDSLNRTLLRASTNRGYPSLN